MIVKLRADVEVSADEHGHCSLTDRLTGRSFEVSHMAGLLTSRLAEPLETLIDIAQKHHGSHSCANDIHSEFRAWVEQLDALGLIERGLSKDAIEDLQRKAQGRQRSEQRWDELVAAVEYAYERIPFHRQRMRDARLTPRDIKAPEDFERIPVMTKRDLRENFPDRLLPEGEDLSKLIETGHLVLASTSGTTSERLQVLFDQTAGHIPDCYRSLWALPTSVELTRGAIFTTPICSAVECHLGSRTARERTRGTTLTLNSSDDLFMISDGEVAGIVDEMRAYDVHALFVNPWYGVWLAHRASSVGLGLPTIPVLLPAYQYLTHRHRAELANAFHSRVFSYYGATDLGGSQIGVECHRGSLHAREDQVYVELTRGNERVVTGELGRVTVSTLSNRWMPLLRYQVGDLGREATTPCGCEWGPLWRSLQLEGRERDLLRTTDGNLLTTREIDDAIGVNGPLFYQVSQLGPSRYRIESWGSSDAVVEQLHRLLGPGARLERSQVEYFAPEPSLKFRQTSSYAPPSL